MRLSFALVFAAGALPDDLAEPAAPAGARLLQVAALLVHELVDRADPRRDHAAHHAWRRRSAGSVIAFQAGLSVAQTADPTNGGVQGAIIGNFLGMVGVDADLCDRSAPRCALRPFATATKSLRPPTR